MTCFSDQIKNALKSFVIKLYKIAKQYSFMSLTRVEESMGLSPITYKQELLGSRDSQENFLREPTLDEATKTQTFKKIPSVTVTRDRRGEASNPASSPGTRGVWPI